MCWRSVASPQDESLGLFYTLLFLVHCLEHSKALSDQLACWDENPSKWHQLKGAHVFQQLDDSGNKCFLFFPQGDDAFS